MQQHASCQSFKLLLKNCTLLLKQLLLRHTYLRGFSNKIDWYLKPMLNVILNCRIIPPRNKN